MEVRKLYYEDCHRDRFEAAVTSCEKVAGGWQITLDATAFYPEGGGQACDLGSLGDARVLDVQETGENVVHLCDKPLEVGMIAEGQIDWQRRFDLMQQHTGEHILSGLINKRFGYHNVGFHIGNQTMEVDFDGPITLEELLELEAQANAIVWQNLPVACWYPSREELPQIQYRSKKALQWPVRIVRVEGADTCACCGVHTAFTGEVGLIKVLSCVKFHQGVRIEMLCGGRAYRYMTAIHEENRQVSQVFSAKMLSTGAAAKQFSQQLTQEKYRANGLEKRLYQAIAKNYVNYGNVVHFESELTSGAVRELADAIAAVCGGVAAVFSGNDENGYMVCMLHHSGDVKELGSQMAKTLNGRGGGKPGSFQGSLRATRQQIEAFFRQR